MSTFVRAEMYVEPPAKGASVQEWKEWLKKDKAEAIKAKRAYTKSCAPGELPQAMSDTILRKVNGRWKQVAAVGCTGDENSYSLEPMVDAIQERSYDEARFSVRARGTSRQRSGSEKRKLRKLRRKMIRS
jgi:hypothetical protein